MTEFISKRKPVLIGFLVDISGSMLQSIKNEYGRTETKIEGFFNSLEHLIEKATDICKDEDNNKILPFLHVFALGFGYNSLEGFIYGGEKLKNLLYTSSNSETISIDELSFNWEIQKKYFTELFGFGVFPGPSPMLEGIQKALNLFSNDDGVYTNPRILFILSDGKVKHKDQILKVVNELEQNEVKILSCYFTDSDLVDFKQLYSSVQNSWDTNTKFMFEIASKVPIDGEITELLEEYGWKFNHESKFFAQVNQSKTIDDFLDNVLLILKVKQSKFQFLADVKKLISENLLSQAFQFIQIYFTKYKKFAFSKLLVTIISDFNENQRLKNLGLISFELAIENEKKIRLELLDLVENYVFGEENWL